jgi:hypothetical protein
VQRDRATTIRYFLSYREFLELLVHFPKETKIAVFVDACRSGQLVEECRGRGLKNVAIFASAQASNKSRSTRYESGTADSTCFTRWLVTALDDPSQNLTLSGLKDHMEHGSKLMHGAFQATTYLPAEMAAIPVSKFFGDAPSSSLFPRRRRDSPLWPDEVAGVPIDRVDEDPADGEASRDFGVLEMIHDELLHRHLLRCAVEEVRLDGANQTQSTGVFVLFTEMLDSIPRGVLDMHNEAALDRLEDIATAVYQDNGGDAKALLAARDAAREAVRLLVPRRE